VGLQVYFLVFSKLSQKEGAEHRGAVLPNNFSFFVGLVSDGGSDIFHTFPYKQSLVLAIECQRFLYRFGEAVLNIFFWFFEAGRFIVFVNNQRLGEEFGNVGGIIVLLLTFACLAFDGAFLDF
jgi:hypothetical protein